MLENGVHFGHKASRWNPKMKKYIYTKNSGIHIIDLNHTADLFSDALNFIHSQIVEGKTILMVANKPQAAEILVEYASVLNVPYVVNRWLGGTLTNFTTIKKRIRHYKDLETKLASNDMERYTKKEKSVFQKEYEKLDKTFRGIRDLVALPDMIFVTDVNHDMIAVIEAIKVGIPVVGFADTNVDPLLLNYPIPANDDAPKSLRYLLGVINEVILDAKKNQKKKEEEVEVSDDAIKVIVTEDVVLEKEGGEGARSAVPGIKGNPKALGKVALKSKKPMKK